MAEFPHGTIAGDDLKRVSDWLDAAYETLGGEKRTDTSVSLADMARDNRDASHALAEGRRSSPQTETSRQNSNPLT